MDGFGQGIERTSCHRDLPPVYAKRMREIPSETAQTANPVQTMVIFRVKKKFRGNCVDPGEISANLRILSSLQYVVSHAD